MPKPTNEIVQHSPAPWVLKTMGRDITDEYDPNAYIADANGKVIGVIDEDLDDDRMTANVNVVLAAPDGYKIGRKVLAYLQGVQSGVPFEESDLVGELMSFLAKAEGNS